MSGPWFPTPEQLWYGQEVGPALWTARAALWPLSMAYAAGAAAHRALFRWGVLHVHHAPVPVLAVGNVVAGGAGKTPVVKALAYLAVAQGIRTAVLCRGYGVDVPATGLLVSRGQEPLVGWRSCGDEPYLLARSLVGVPVLAGPNRAALAGRAAASLGAQVVILDDGMQHHRLHQDALVAVVRAPQPNGNGWPLPMGPLRERASGLARADLVVAMGGNPPSVQEALERAGVAADKILSARLEPSGLKVLPSGERWPLAWLKGRRVMAAAAIGRPSAFVRTLEQAGAVVLDWKAWPDHAVVDANAVAELERQATRVGAEALVVTEKDAIKMDELPAGQVARLALEVEVAWDTPSASDRLQSMLWTLANVRPQGLT